MKNPFINDHRRRLCLSFQEVPKSTKRLLDFGSGDRNFTKGINKKIPKAKIYTYEKDKSKKSNLKTTKSLNNNSLDVVTILDVIEHVPDEIKVINEIHRILKPGGLLLLSTPHKGLTEIFDPGNIKFRFPILHKFLYKTIFKQSDYNKKFKGELIGDVSKQQNLWHRHYSLLDLKKILENKFKIQNVYYYSLFYPILSMLDQSIKWLFKKDIKFLSKLILIDSRTNYNKLSFSIFIKATKI